MLAHALDRVFLSRALRIVLQAVLRRCSWSSRSGRRSAGRRSRSRTSRRRSSTSSSGSGSRFSPSSSATSGASSRRGARSRTSPSGCSSSEVARRAALRVPAAPRPLPGRVRALLVRRARARPPAPGRPARARRRGRPLHVLGARRHGGVRPRRRGRTGGEGFAAAFGLLARIAPFTVRDGRIALRWPFTGLGGRGSRHRNARGHRGDARLDELRRLQPDDDLAGPARRTCARTSSTLPTWRADLTISLVNVAGLLVFVAAVAVAYLAAIDGRRAARPAAGALTRARVPPLARPDRVRVPRSRTTSRCS